MRTQREEEARARKAIADAQAAATKIAENKLKATESRRLSASMFHQAEQLRQLPSADKGANLAAVNQAIGGTAQAQKHGVGTIWVQNGFSAAWGETGNKKPPSRSTT